MTQVPMINTYDCNVEAEKLIVELDANGCVIVEGHINDTRLQQLHTELQPYLDNAPLGKTDFAG